MLARGQRRNLEYRCQLETVALRILQADMEPELIYITAVACEHITGPFSWEEAESSY